MKKLELKIEKVKMHWWNYIRINNIYYKDEPFDKEYVEKLLEKGISQYIKNFVNIAQMLQE